MSMVLPSTVEEINYMQSSFYSPRPVCVKDTGEDFPNINIDAVRYKREVSLPNGVQWNVSDSDFNRYLNFEDPNLVNTEVAQSHEDRLVPGDDQRPRSESISSVTSNMEDKNFVYNNMAVKSFSTVCMDSGSTCVSTDHAYVNLAPSVFKELDTEETFQNLNPFLSQGPEIHNTDSTASSSFSSSNSPLNDSHLDYSILSNLSAISTNSQDSFSEKSVTFKRPASTIDEDIFYMTTSKRSCESPDGSRYLEIRKKNNAASKNCRKTRKEKQKDMESRVADLEREREDLIKQIRYLEVMTNEFRKHIKSIMKPLHAV